MATFDLYAEEFKSAEHFIFSCMGSNYDPVVSILALYRPLIASLANNTDRLLSKALIAKWLLGHHFTLETQDRRVLNVYSGLIHLVPVAANINA